VVREKEEEGREMSPVTLVDLDPVLLVELSAATITQVESSTFVNATPACFFALHEREYPTTSRELHLYSWNAVKRYRRK